MLEGAGRAREGIAENVLGGIESLSEQIVHKNSARTADAGHTRIPGDFILFISLFSISLVQ